VRRAIDESAEGDVGAWFRVTAEDVRVYPRPAEPDAAEVYNGLDGLMEYLTNWYSQWDEYEAELVGLEPAGERVLAVFRERGRVERTGLEVEEEFTHSFLVRDGKIAEWHMYDSNADARAALGLPPA
jgi:ketosteroid isomerase-like protein